MAEARKVRQRLSDADIAMIEERTTDWRRLTSGQSREDVLALIAELRAERALIRRVHEKAWRTTGESHENDEASVFWDALTAIAGWCEAT